MKDKMISVCYSILSWRCCATAGSGGTNSALAAAAAEDKLHVITDSSSLRKRPFSSQ
jgi:hypothetical protein